MSVLEERLALAIDLARSAGRLVREGYGRAAGVRHKGAIDLVTEVDLHSEALLIAGIQRAFPNDAILAEEGGLRGDAPQRWVLDPLDGTVNYAHGVPVFSVSIAYVEGTRPLVGVIYDPLRNELFHASAGGGAWLNDGRVHTSATRDLNDGLLVTGFAYDVRTTREDNFEYFQKLALRSQGVRRLGSAALDLAYVAAGRFDAYWELSLAPWDLAAGCLLVAEAGGRVTKVNGDPEPLSEPISILATNGHLHPSMLGLLNVTA
jgi:myo-inositol-1(or 4)-monophosphatase